MKTTSTTKKLHPLFSDITAEEKKPHLDIDLDAVYQHAFSELGLQQTKRDQIITLYLAIASFLIPFALSMEGISLQVKGLIFLVTALVGVMFSLIIIRYRIYKEVYWLCCQSLSVLHGIRKESLNKYLIQKVFYQTLKKKAKGFMVGSKTNMVFSKTKYVKKNLFSSESLYFFIHILLTTMIFGLSIALIFADTALFKVFIGVLTGIVLFVWLAAKYFTECIQIYAVAVKETDEAFNKAFSKAWFLHFYI